MADAVELKKDLWKRIEQSPFIVVDLTGTHGSSSARTTASPLAKGGAAMAQYVSKGHDLFACLSGSVRVDNDRSMIDKLWSKPVEAWFPRPKQDQNDEYELPLALR